MSDTPDISGRGFTFPFRVDKTGSIALTTGADDIESAMRGILCTAPGERVMRPEFGCKIWDLLFEPIDANTLVEVLRKNGILDVGGYRKLGRNQLRIGMFPAIDPADTEALTACLDYCIQAMS